MKHKMSIQAALFTLGLSPLFISCIVLTIISAVRLSSGIKTEMSTATKIAAYDLASYYHTHEIEYDHTYVDHLQGINTELTVFLGDTRYVTSLYNDQGERNEGTAAAADIYNQVYNQKQDYSAEGVVIGNKKYLVYYTPLYDADDQVIGMAFAGKSQESVSAEIRNAVTIIIIVAIFICIICTAATLLVVQKIKKPVVSVASTISTLASGDLSPTETASSNLKEISALADAANTLQKNLSGIVSTIKQTTTDLTTLMNSVNMMCIDGAQNTNQIKGSMEELASSTEMLAQSVTSVNGEVIDIGGNIDTVKNTANNLELCSGRITVANDESRTCIASVQEESQRTISSMSDILKRAEATQEAADKISGAASVINEIAQQTNLLSLNASIEAARVGDAGRGFAVVAENIKQLAEQSAQSAMEISEVIKELRAEAAASVSSATEMQEIVEEETQAIAEVNKKFDVLTSEITMSLEYIKNIDSMTDDMVSHKDTIVGNISDLSAISQENSANNSIVSENVTILSEAMARIADHSDNMVKMAGKLSELVNEFIGV